MGMGREAAVRAREMVGGGEGLVELRLERALLVRWGLSEAFEEASWRVVVDAGRAAMIGQRELAGQKCNSALTVRLAGLQYRLPLAFRSPRPVLVNSRSATSIDRTALLPQHHSTGTCAPLTEPLLQLANELERASIDPLGCIGRRGGSPPCALDEASGTGCRG